MSNEFFVPAGEFHGVNSGVDRRIYVQQSFKLLGDKSSLVGKYVRNNDERGSVSGTYDRVTGHIEIFCGSCHFKGHLIASENGTRATVIAANLLLKDAVGDDEHQSLQYQFDPDRCDFLNLLMTQWLHLPEECKRQIMALVPGAKDPQAS